MSKYIKCFILILVIGFVQNSAAAMRVSGFTSENLSKAHLNYTISGETTRPVFFDNLDKYVQLSSFAQGENGHWSVQVRDISWDQPRPQNVKKLNEVSEDEQRYLQATFSIQTDKVQRLIQNILANKDSYDRLSASTEIQTILNQLVVYDTESFNNRFVGRMPTTEAILQAGKGVCFEFAIVFVAAARAVGIPARMINGFKITANAAMPHAWVEIKANDETWWPLEPQSTAGFLPSTGYFPTNEYRVFEGNSIAELQKTYAKEQQPIDLQWVNGGITFMRLPN